MLSLEVLKERSRLFKRVRDFFYDRDFIEADTPCFSNYATSEPYLDSYSVFNAKGEREGYLITSPEALLKQVLQSGVEKVFELAHSFRADEKGDWHSREFIMLEWYVRGQSYEAMMDECHALIECALERSCAIEKISIDQWFVQQLGHDSSRSSLEKNLKERGVEDVEQKNYDDLFFRCFLPTEQALAEKEAVILYDYPEALAAYAEVEDGVAKRFEVYLQGVECANAYLELKSAKELEKRFKAELESREKMGKTIMPLNPSFMKALDELEEEITGIALGLDRLLAIKLKEKGLRQVSPYSLST